MDTPAQLHICCTGKLPASPSMNSYFSVTGFLGEEGRRFSQEFGLHTKFPVLAFQFAQAGAFADVQGRLFPGVLLPVPTDPGAQRSLVH
ncbi:hypothetical protein [Streptomyces sp. NPDC055109]